MNTIYTDIRDEFGSSSVGAQFPKYTISIRQASRLLNKYDKAKASTIAKRYSSIMKEVTR